MAAFKLILLISNKQSAKDVCLHMRSALLNTYIEKPLVDMVWERFQQ